MAGITTTTTEEGKQDDDVGGYWLTISHTYGESGYGGTVNVTDTGMLDLGSDVRTYVDPFTPTGNYQYLEHEDGFDVPYETVEWSVE